MCTPVSFVVALKTDDRVYFGYVVTRSRVIKIIIIILDP